MPEPKWDRSPILVNDHDFRSDASGVGISYGIYDPPHNRGSVCVGVSHDTPAFAGPFHRHLVETRGFASLGPCSQASGFGRFRRQQQLHLLGLENRNPGAHVQCIRHHHYDRSLPYRRVQMESIEHRLFSEISKTGLPNHWTAMKKCSTSFALPVPKLAWL